MSNKAVANEHRHKAYTHTHTLHEALTLKKQKTLSSRKTII